MSLDDEILVRNSLDGDPAALDALLRRHRPSVLRQLSRYPLPVAERTELTHKTMNAVAEQLKKCPSDGAFHRWLYRVTATTAYAHMRLKRSA